MKQKIFFDWDGTLVNSLNRMYSLFCYLVNSSCLSYEQYWEIKKNGVNQAQILTEYFCYNFKQIKDFRTKWFSLIEHDEWLKLDILYNDTEFVLKNLFKQHDLYIVTGRQFLDKVNKQVVDFKIEKYVQKIFSTCQNTTKYELITSNISNLNELDMLIGDTVEDIESGKKLNIKTIGITTGMLNKTTLLKYYPTRVYDSLMDFYHDNKTV